MRCLLVRLFVPIIAFIYLMLGPPAWCQAPIFTITTFAGNGSAGYSGDGGLATAATLNGPAGVAVDKFGNVYVSDFNNNVVRKIDTNGIITTFAGTGQAGYSGDGGQAAKATLDGPEGLATSIYGKLYICDTSNFAIRAVDLQTGVITTFAGGTPGYSGDGGFATKASLYYATAVAVDDVSASVLISDTYNQVIRKVNVLGIIQTVAGNINQSAGGYTGDGVPAVGTYLNAPRGVVAGGYGSFYFADQTNNRVRYVDPNGIIHTVAGNGTQGYSGDNGKAAEAEVNLPAAVTMYPPEGANPTLFIADSSNQVIRAVDPGGTIYTVAGNGTAGSGGDRVPATAASFHSPIALAMVNGNIYVADYKNNEVRYLKQIIPLPAVSPGGVVSASAFGKLPGAAPGSWIEIYGSSLAAGTRLWASSDFTNGVDAPTSLEGTSVTIGGLSAFVSYISPNQVNVQVPGTIAPGPQPLIVTTAGGNSAAYSLTINAAEPGLLAPSSFNLKGVQYVVAFNPDGSYVLPIGAIAGLTSHPAKPGDTIVMYGIGFGAVQPSIPAGQLVKQDNTLANPFDVSMGGVHATAQYDGLAPNYVGLYQFNVVVPNVGPGSAVPLTFTLGGAPDSQTLNLAVQ